MWWISLGPGHSHDVSLALLALTGLCIGYIAGMFGVGGGFLLVPVLMYVFNVPPLIAVGSATCQQCGTSLASFLKYRHLKRGEPRIDIVMLGGSLMGVDAGARLLSWLETRGDFHLNHGVSVPAARVVLDILFFCLLTFIAVTTFREALRAMKRAVPRGDTTIPGPLVTRIRIPPYLDLPNVQLEQVSVPMIAYLGFLLGLLSGLMGLGGGVLLMPVLMYGFGLSLRNAAGTGILLLFFTVATGTVEQALRNHVNLSLAMAILIGSSIGSQLGALTTHYLPNRTLRLIFSFLVSLTVVMIAWDLLRVLKFGK